MKAIFVEKREEAPGIKTFSFKPAGKLESGCGAGIWLHQNCSYLGIDWFFL